MKITFVTTSLNSGGAERVISILANGLYGRGHDVEVTLLTKPVVFYEMHEGVKIHLLTQQYNNNFVRKLLWLRQHVEKEKRDVVIAFMTPVFCATLFALLGSKIPVITAERIDPAFSSWFRKILRGILLPATTHHVVQTNDIKRYYSKNIQDKTSIIYNPVNEAVFEKYNVEKQDVIISVGRLFKQKNFAMLIEVFKRVSNEFPTYLLFIYGEGYLRPMLEKQIEDAGLKGRVFLPGRTRTIFPELAKARIFCMTSDFEGMSNAMIEALCMGLPVVTTRVSGTDELIEEGENGFVVEARDVDGFVSRLKCLLNDRELQERMSKNAKEKVSMFKKEKIITQWENLTRSVVEGKNR